MGAVELLQKFIGGTVHRNQGERADLPGVAGVIEVVVDGDYRMKIGPWILGPRWTALGSHEGGDPVTLQVLCPLSLNDEYSALLAVRRRGEENTVAIAISDGVSYRELPDSAWKGSLINKSPYRDRIRFVPNRS